MVQSCCPGHTPQLSGHNTGGFFVISSKRKEGVVVLHLPIELLKTCSGLEPVLRCKPSTYQAVSRWLNHSTIETSL